MSDVRRWRTTDHMRDVNLSLKFAESFGDSREHYVLASDYDALKAENERLRAFQLLDVHAICDERDALKAQNFSLRAALLDLYKQVKDFCERQGEADFYTGNAMAALRISANPVHLQTLRDLMLTV
jgi:hypothetical protein